MAWLQVGLFECSWEWLWQPAASRQAGYVEGMKSTGRTGAGRGLEFAIRVVSRERAQSAVREAAQCVGVAVHGNQPRGVTSRAA